MAMADAPGFRPARFLPLRGLTNVLTILLAGSVILAAGTLSIPLFQLPGTAWLPVLWSVSWLLAFYAIAGVALIAIIRIVSAGPAGQE